MSQKVGTAKLEDESVTSAKLANSAVSSSSKIAAGAVGTACLSDGAVTRKKIAGDVFPLHATKSVEKAYSLAAGANMRVQLPVAAVNGYTFVCLPEVGTGSPNVVIAAWSGAYVHIRNLASYTIDGKVIAKALYLRA